MTRFGLLQIRKITSSLLWMRLARPRPVHMLCRGDLHSRIDHNASPCSRTVDESGERSDLLPWQSSSDRSLSSASTSIVSRFFAINIRTYVNPDIILTTSQNVGFIPHLNTTIIRAKLSRDRLFLNRRLSHAKIWRSIPFVLSRSFWAWIPAKISLQRRTRTHNLFWWAALQEAHPYE